MTAETAMTPESIYERRVLSGALNLYRKQLQRRIRATDRQGWEPKPGTNDSNRKRLTIVDELMARWHLTPWGP